MRETSCDILIAGGGTGGVAAALAACSLGFKVILTEESDWVGGQLTSQAVPPDEHPWIEEFGCTARYRAFRGLVRAYYRAKTPLKQEFRNDPHLNPGGGWVSALCHEPRIAWLVLLEMLQPAVASGNLEVRLKTKPRRADTDGGLVRSVTFRNLDTGEDEVVVAKYVLDATELGDLLPMSSTNYVSGAEAYSETHELNAVTGLAEPENVQGLTWVMAVANDEGSHRVINKPSQYGYWRSYKPDFWPGPLLGFEVLHAHTGERRTLPLFSQDWYALFPYRQIIDPSKFEPGHAEHPATLVNWPQNDYFDGNIIDQTCEVVDERLAASRQLSLSLLYWLQTEAPRHDGGTGYPGLHLRPDITGTDDGLAMAPYIRESRRIRSKFTITEQMVATYTNPGLAVAPVFWDSVGVGSYRIDLHPSTSGAGTIDTPTLPFQIPLGALIPLETINLLPACKNIGTTHITNGCYRLHPVEWNIGEVAGLLAGYCLLNGVTPSEVYECSATVAEFQRLLRAQGIELEWPQSMTMPLNLS
jgi:hypothetical protein